MTRPAAINVGQSSKPKLSDDGQKLVISIAISLRRQGGRRQVVTPANAAPWIPPAQRADNTIVKALVRAHRWRNMLEAKLFVTVRDLAKAENINESYLGRVLRLTLLSPSITGAILSGRQPQELELSDLLQPFPAEWALQDAFFGSAPKKQ
jgi:hypothetical protein